MVVGSSKAAGGARVSSRHLGEPQPPPEGAAFLLLLHKAGSIPSARAWRPQPPWTHGRPTCTQPV